jgi:ubiquinone/menaquinone biosynthesis C-methylase UbiE
MNAETAAMLCNPKTHEPLNLMREQEPDGTTRESLVSVQSGERFPFRDGIPVLYDAARLSGYDLQYQGFYQRAARFYDAALKMLAILYGGSEAAFRKLYLEQLEVHPGDRVLEVSVGTGANLRYLPSQAKCYGLDLSWAMLDRCQENIRRWKRPIELFYGNAEELPFRDEMFDVVFHVGGINAFNDRAKAICEMIRVARPGTRIVIVDESAKMMKALSWMPSARKMVAEWGDRFEAPLRLVPPEMMEIQASEIVKGFFYMLCFRKP